MLSCFGKFFTSVVNSRLAEYLEDHGLLCEEQAGFRSGYCATDHVFTLSSLINIYLSRGSRIYAAFVDFWKAFDNVWRVGLWQKFLRHNINGKICKVIRSLYTESCEVMCKSQQLQQSFYIIWVQYWGASG